MKTLKNFENLKWIWKLEKKTWNGHLVLGDPVPVEDEELETDVVQIGGVGRQIENERFVENGVQRALLNVRLLLGHPLAIVNQVDLHVGIWIVQTKHSIIHFIIYFFYELYSFHYFVIYSISDYSLFLIIYWIINYLCIIDCLFIII